MKRCLTTFFLLNVLMFSFNMVSAVPPTTTQFIGNNGLDIQGNIFDYYKINTSSELHIYVFNISSGEILTNETTKCEVELTDKTGTVLLSGSPVGDEDHFLMTRNESVVTKVGIYGVSIICNSSGVGGYKTAFFEATTTGNAPPGDVVILGFIIIMLTIFIFMTVYLVRAVGLMIEASFDVLDIAYAWGLYFGLLGVNLFAGIYLGDVIVNNFLNVLIKILAFPFVVLPVIAFFLSLFRGMKQAKEKKAEW